MNNVKPDPQYDFIPPLPPSGHPTSPKRGSQCGECGAKFEYGVSYGFYCGSQRCPTGWAAFSHITSLQPENSK